MGYGLDSIHTPRGVINGTRKDGGAVKEPDWWERIGGKRVSRQVRGSESPLHRGEVFEGFGRVVQSLGKV